MKEIRTVLIFARRFFPLYLVTLFLFLINNLHAGSSSFASSTDPSGIDHLFANYSEYLWGVAVQTSGSRSFYFPLEWMAVLAIHCLFVAVYSTDHHNGLTMQIATRLQTRTAQWISAILWCAFSTLVFFFIVWLSVILGSASNIRESSSCYQILGELTLDSCLYLFALPLLASFGISVFQMALSTMLNNIAGLAAALIYLSLTVVSSSPMLLGNMLMISRSEIGIPQQADPLVSISFALLWICIWFFIGLAATKKAMTT